MTNFKNSVGMKPPHPVKWKNLHTRLFDDKHYFCVEKKNIDDR